MTLFAPLTVNRLTKMALAAVFIAAIACAPQARANDLPLASASPLTGVAFDDRPLMLPVQRNFQMAMLTAGSELGRSCGKMEAYGWRMTQTEQGRVNQIFNNTVDRMRLLGYTIAPQTLTSVSNDITLFTADNRDRHFIFLWSAGELGLVMTLCETSAPLVSTYHPTPAAPAVQTFPVPNDVVSAHLETPARMETKTADDNFTPLGEWIGGYTCSQGYTGGTLKVNRLNGKDFEGTFKFYPTVKNPDVPDGEYTVLGQYDKASRRILINPGKWIKRPHNYYDTVLVGSFDATQQTFSAYFQGVAGCTSFEARRMEQPAVQTSKKHKKAKPAAKKPARKKVSSRKSAPVAGVPMPSEVATDIIASERAAALAPAAAPMTAVPPASAPAVAPASVALPPVAAASALAAPAAQAATAAPLALAPLVTPNSATIDDKKDPGGIVLSSPAR